MSQGAHPTFPRSVVVVSDQDYKLVLQDPDGVERLEDREALVIPYAAKPEVNESDVEATRALLRSAGLLASGALLVQNPYEVSSYVPAGEALETLAVAKYHHLAVVAALLGANEVKVTDAKVERRRSDTGGSVRIGAKGASADADMSAEFASELAAHLRLETEFAGSEPEPDAALSYLQEHNLLGEHSMAALVELRKGKNPVVRYQLTLDAAKESQRNIKSALKVATALPKFVELDGEFRRAASSIESVKITTEIRFPRAAG